MGTAHRHGHRRVPVPETRETLELEEEFRRTKLAEVTIALLAVLLPQSGLITVEDAHFMDEASADLFGHVARAVRLTSWIWCVTRRDVGSGFIAPDDTPTTRIELASAEPGGSRPSSRWRRPTNPPCRHGNSNCSSIDPAAIPSSSENSWRRCSTGIPSGPSPTRSRTSSSPASTASPLPTASLLRRMSVLGQSFSTDLLAEVVDDVPDRTDPIWARLEPFIVRRRLR